MNETGSPFLTPGRVVAAILVVSAAGKLAAMLALGDRVYPDVGLALGFGRAARGLEPAGAANQAHELLLNSKTLLGPILWSWIHDLGGLAGLKAVNLALFLALFGLQHALGRGAYPPAVVGTALFLCAFYVGTNLNVIAGEQDDMMVGVLVAAAVLLHVRRNRPFPAGLILGIAFLFKFTAAVFAAGFVVHLLLERQGRAALRAVAGLAVPFVIYNLITRGAGLDSLLHALEIQRRFSPWSEVAFKLLSTGLAPVVALSAWVASRRLGGHDRLFFSVSAAYLPYVLIMQDAYSAGYVMMTCLVFSSFLIARFLAPLRARPGRTGWGRPLFIALLATYLAATTAVTAHNLLHDTEPLAIRTSAPPPVNRAGASPPESRP